ncbi:MAG TPA: adenylate/guanylate cyclase domain-containing protein [Methylomirabilota bacterium]|nr:adenylate/guanylate cyclase domain-containing protein [Methylomirabilota bacterium]
MPACPRCGHPARTGARFCSSCGAPLVAAPDPARFAAPAAYTPPHLAARIRDQGARLSGERKQVTVLFADVQGSMELLAERDPEEAGRILDQVLEQMMEAVHRYEGTVNQVMGDGIMALFGAPLAHEDHAVRACYAALRMQERITAFGERMRRLAGVPIQIRVGLNSGEVMVRSIENDLSMTYTAVGPTVHLAARMEQMARPGATLATGDTVALAAGRVATRALGPVPVKGLHAPVEMHEVTGAATAQSRAQMLAARGLTPFVGREAELERLLAIVESAEQGPGRIVSVVGEAGVGKSRLAAEVARRARERGDLVLEAAALSYGRAVGHRPGIEIQRRFFRIEPGDDPAAVRAKLAVGVRDLDPALEDVIPALEWFHGVSLPGSPFLALDAGARRVRAMELLVRLIEGIARRQPFVMILEDLQWMDWEGREALDYIVRNLPPRTMVLATYRPEHDDGWSRRRGYTRLRLEPLRPAGADVLLGELLGHTEETAAIRRIVGERARGNPLFLEESIHSLVDAGVLSGSPGAYRVMREVGTLEVPASVRAVLAARIDRLPAEEKRLLQAAAVIGEEVPAPLLEAVADAPVEAVREALARLRDAELLTETAMFPDPVHAFRHSLIHDVAYESLLHDRRRALHARIARAMESRADAHVAPIERLAHHAFAGALWEEAARYGREAGLRALGRLACREAVEFLHRALEAISHIPASQEMRTLAVDVGFDLQAGLIPLGSHAEALSVLRSAEALAQDLSDERRLARALAYRSTMHWEMGDSDAAVEAGGRAVAIAERLQDVALQVVGNFGLGGAVRTLGDYPRANVHLRRSLALLAAERPDETFGLPGLAGVLSRAHLGWSLAELGEFEDAITVTEEGIRLAEKAGHGYSLAYALLGLGGVLLRRGATREALPVLERGIALCADAPVLFPPLAGDLAIIRALDGRLTEAADLATQAVGRGEHMGRLGRLSLIIVHLGEVLIIGGRAAEALGPARRALAMAREHKERGNEAYALRLLSLAVAEGPKADLATARGHAEEGLALAETLGMRPLVARGHLGLSRLARRAGDAAGAARHLEVAARMLRELGMTYWLTRLDRDRVGPGGPDATRTGGSGRGPRA